MNADPPGPLYPWYLMAVHWCWGWLCWPVQKRQLKREGWTKDPEGWWSPP